MGVLFNTFIAAFSSIGRVSCYPKSLLSSSQNCQAPFFLGESLLILMFRRLIVLLAMIGVFAVANLSRKPLTAPSGIIASVLTMSRFETRFGADPSIQGAIVSTFSGT